MAVVGWTDRVDESRVGLGDVCDCGADFEVVRQGLEVDWWVFRGDVFLGVGSREYFDSRTEFVGSLKYCRLNLSGWNDYQN